MAHPWRGIVRRVQFVDIQDGSDPPPFPGLRGGCAAEHPRRRASGVSAPSHSRHPRAKPAPTARHPRNFIGHGGCKERGKHARNLLLHGRHVEPAPLRPGLETKFGKLHTLRAFAQRPGKRFVFDHVAQEEFPLHLERVVRAVVSRLRDLPGLVVDRAVHVGIPHAARGGRAVLHRAVAHPCDGRRSWLEGMAGHRGRNQAARIFRRTSSANSATSAAANSSSDKLSSSASGVRSMA